MTTPTQALSPPDRCTVCDGIVPAPSALAERSTGCTCAIYRTDGVLSGAYRLRHTRIFARTLLRVWVECDKSDAQACRQFCLWYPHLRREQVLAAIHWLKEHGWRVVKESIAEELEGAFDEGKAPLVHLAQLAKACGVSRKDFLDGLHLHLAALAERAWRSARQGERT